MFLSVPAVTKYDEPEDVIRPIIARTLWSSFAVSNGCTTGSLKNEVMACGIGLLGRSEEHTSELQSLMRISYAVFCLKKKKNKQNTNRMLQKMQSHIMQ